MRVVLVTLSGDAKFARTAISARWTSAEIVPLERSVLDTGSFGFRLAAVRKMRPDAFAIMTESLDWQYGQDALLFFGALAGARESAIFDARGSMRCEKRRSLLLRSPVRLLSAFVKGRRALARAASALQDFKRRVAETTSENRPRISGNSLSIAYLRATPAAGTQPGGAASHINGVVSALLSLDAKIDFISNDDVAGLDKTRVKFTKFAPDTRVMPRAAFDIHNGVVFSAAASATVASSPPDFIYQRYSRFSFAGVEAVLRSGRPLFLEYNGSEVWVGKHWDRTERLDLLEQYEKLNLAAATRIFVVSEVERTNLLKRGIADERIIVNPNGVDTDVFRPGAGGGAERARLGIEDETFVAGFVGTFGPWHGVDVLADAIAMVPKTCSIKFLMVGEGSLRSEVERRLTASGDIDRALFTGRVEHDRVPAILDACDILISPHARLAAGEAFFGSPTKLFEYMAMGKGIAASRLGQIGEVLTHGETALLVEPGAASELCDAIQRLARDQELAKQLGSAARAEAIAKHTWRQNAERVLKAYEELMATK